jgi:hypothetical protein
MARLTQGDWDGPLKDSVTGLKDVRELIRTIDWFLTLPSEDDRLVRKARGEARGLNDGIALALRLKFGQRGKTLIAKVRQTDDLKTLRRVTRSIDKAATIDDVRKAFSARA